MSIYSHETVLLYDHLTDVANSAKRLAEESNFSCPDIAYFAGLFHDLGKLNPYYQKIFLGMPKEQAKKSFDAFHAPFSGWIAKNLLENMPMLDETEKMRICMLIYGHHSKMHRSPGNHKFSKKYGIVTVDGLLTNWENFKREMPYTMPLKKLDLDVELDADYFKYGTDLELALSENGIEAFLQCGYFFSCLLQADRGSFGTFDTKKLDNFLLDTKKMNNNNKLSIYRDSFQSTVQKQINVNNPINIICAPTGSGKTRAFLDLIPRYSPDRVFYFSPLLALTDDIAEKIHDIANEPEQILVYNHTFSDYLANFQADEEPNNEQKWNFDIESFNEKIVITTTQRLLMTLYSNYHKDKIKFASFRNSLLIVDEVQTLPKFLLDNLIDILKIMTKKMGTKALLVSATIPDELKDLPLISMPDEKLHEYMKQKQRNIVLKPELDIQQILPNSMVMLNTRKRAVEEYKKIIQAKPNVYYVSSGVTKRNRKQIISNSRENKDSILVTTQTLEAGVDISFSYIWRQMAPLDNIIQVLGRLDREAENTNTCAYIFDIDNPTNNPYESLEYITSQDMIKVNENELTTSTLYKILPQYYKKIHQLNKTQQKHAKELRNYIDTLDFINVWDIVNRNIGESYYDAIYIPKKEDWQQCKDDLLSGKKYLIKRHLKDTALLPIPPYKIQHYWDPDLYEQNILLPKLDTIDDVYDNNLGLDKWITTK